MGVERVASRDTHATTGNRMGVERGLGYIQSTMILCRIYRFSIPFFLVYSNGSNTNNSLEYFLQHTFLTDTFWIKQ